MKTTASSTTTTSQPTATTTGRIIEVHLARDAFVGTNRRAIAVMFVRLSIAVCLSDRRGTQTISSTRPSCYIHLSTVGVINIAADHQMFRTLDGEIS